MKSEIGYLKSDPDLDCPGHGPSWNGYLKRRDTQIEWIPVPKRVIGQSSASLQLYLHG